MENAGVQKKQTGQSPSVARALWDPFGFMQEMFGWGRSVDGPLFEVKETDDTYVCTVKVNLTLPDQADVTHAKAELENGQLTLVVPKAAAMLATQSPAQSEPSPESSPQTEPSPESAPQSSSAAPEPEPSPRRTRRAKGTSKGSESAGRTPRRGTRTPARRGR
jgi:hypothetical protein